MDDLFPEAGQMIRNHWEGDCVSTDMKTIQLESGVRQVVVNNTGSPIIVKLPEGHEFWQMACMRHNDRLLAAITEAARNRISKALEVLGIGLYFQKMTIVRELPAAVTYDKHNRFWMVSRPYGMVSSCGECFVRVKTGRWVVIHWDN